MAGDVRCDLSELKGFRDRLEKAASDEAIARLCNSCAKEIAGRLLRAAIKRTPTGVYPAESGKTGGTLKRGWTASPLTVIRTGTQFTVTVANPAEYAAYVEYGHRQQPGRYVPAIGKRLKKAWVPGRFMLTISVSEIEKNAPAIIEKKLEKYLKEVFK